MARINIHDPVLDSTPQLRSLKKQLPFAISGFVVGLGVSMALLAWGMQSGVPLIALTAVPVFLGSVGYFAYVTISLSRLGKRARMQQVRAQLADIAAKNPGPAADAARHALGAIQKR